ncbi:FeoC-like transcriptional regulator [Methanosarcina sp. T3]|uniref:FeoC-like transcriptional regulator n=1 Tax=Methanosarcina sp. T3 TaxID=3439062 RepID=UPI003F84500B
MVLGYVYVLKQMEEAEKKGSISFNEISRHLKMSTQQLKGLLEIMEGMGHVEKVTETNPDLSSSCSGSCKNCGCCECSGKIAVLSGTIYRLTEKGRRVCNNRA